MAVQVNGFPSGNPSADVNGVSFASRVAEESVTIEAVSGGLASPPAIPLSPDSVGCTIFEVAPGNYEVMTSQGTAPGSSYTCNNDEVAEPYSPYTTTSTVAVDQALITNVTVQCDEGADVNLGYPSTTAVEDGITCPTTTTVGCLALGESSTSSGSTSAQGAVATFSKSASTWGIGTGLGALVRVNATACTGGATNVCVAVGYGASGGAVAYATSTSPNTWTSSTVSGVADPITAVQCPSASECYAIANPVSSGQAYILQGAVTSSAVTWSVAPVSGISASSISTLSQLVCASTNACFALGTSGSSPLIMDLPNVTSPGTWIDNTPVLSTLLGTLLGALGLGSSTLTQIACPSASLCLAGGTAVELLGGAVVGYSLYITTSNPASLAWNYLALPSGLSLLSGWSALTCDGTALCLAVLTTSSGHPYIVTTPGSSVGLLSWTNTSGLSSITSVNQMSCTGSGPICFATASVTSASTTPTTLLNLPASSSTWATNTGLPTTPVSYNGLSCTSAQCFIYGASSTAAFIDSLNSTSGTPAWTADTLPNTVATSTLFVSGVACEGTTTTCEATGASETRGQLLDYSSGTTTWSVDSASNSLVGLYQAGLPIEINNTGLQPSTTLEDWAPASSTSTDDTEIGPLFPFSTYGVGAGDCPAEDAYWVSVSTPAIAPGDIATNTLSATIPLGLLPIQATNASGSPISGATISIAVDTATGYDTSCATTQTALTGASTNPTSWSLSTSGVDGLSRVAVMYQDYKVTVTSGATHTDLDRRGDPHDGHQRHGIDAEDLPAAGRRPAGGLRPAMTSPGATRRRSARVVRRPDDGFTLVELLISLLLFSILFAMSVPIVNTLLTTESAANSTYANANQLLPVATGIQRLIRSAVSPGPAASGIPVPAFGDGVNTPGLSSAKAPSPTAISMWLYTNEGTEGTNTTWCTHAGGTGCLGPVLVHISCTPNGASTACASSRASLTVTQTLPDAGSCPGVTTGSSCTYNSNPTDTVFTVANLANGSNGATLFSYMLSVPNAASPNTNTLVPAASGTSPNFITSSTVNSTMSVTPNTGLSMFSVCQAGPGYTSSSPSSTPDANCPSAEVDAVNLDIQVSTGSAVANGGQSEDSTIVYMLSPQSSTYESQVG